MDAVTAAFALGFVASAVAAAVARRIDALEQNRRRDAFTVEGIFS